METLIVVALILLLICTLAGIVFIVVTVSDRAEDEAAGDAYDDEDEFYFYRDKDGTSEPPYEDGEYEFPLFRNTGKREVLYRFSKKSNVEQIGRRTRIVSKELKKDFENTLASMKSVPSFTAQDDAVPAKRARAQKAAEASAIDETPAKDEQNTAENIDAAYAADDAYLEDEALFEASYSDLEFIDLLDLVKDGDAENSPPGADDMFIRDEELLIGEEILR